MLFNNDTFMNTSLVKNLHISTWIFVSVHRTLLNFVLYLRYYITFHINGTVEKCLHERTFDGDGRTREIFYNDIIIMMIKKKTKIILEQ